MAPASGSSNASEPWRIRVLPGLAAISYAAWIWWLSSGVHQVGGNDLFWEFLSNSAHYPLFGILSLLLAETFRQEGTLRVAARVRVVWIVLAYGMIDELHQASVPGRTPDPGDVATDALGALGFLLLWWGVRGPGALRRALVHFFVVSVVALTLVAARIGVFPWFAEWMGWTGVEG